MRVVLVSLVNEGVVRVNDRELSLAPEQPRARRAPTAQRPAIERNLIAALARRPRTVEHVVDSGAGWETCRAYQETLEKVGYLRRRTLVDRLAVVSLGAATLLVLVAAIKLVVAISRGRSNVMFLIVSAAAATWFVVKLGRFATNLTTRGRNALVAVGALLEGARHRLKDASPTLSGQELAWIAAAFGFGYFSQASTNFAFWPALAFAHGSRHRDEELFRAAAMSNESSSGTSTGGSSCSTSVSSCGGGGGSSCGGGGGCGGGGCGGCGGGG